MKKWLIIIIVLVLLGIAAYFLFFRKKKDEKSSSTGSGGTGSAGGTGNTGGYSGPSGGNFQVNADFYLKQGSTGDKVKALQDGLIKLRYITSDAVKTGYGIWGPQTQYAWTNFAKDWNSSTRPYLALLSKDVPTFSDDGIETKEDYDYLAKYFLT